MPVTLHKDRVEFALPARMMFAISMSNTVAFDGPEEAMEQGRQDLERLRTLLKQASVAPLHGLPLNIAMVVGQQIDRLHNHAMSDLYNQRGDKVAAAIYYFLKNLIDSEYLELWEGSPVAEAAAMYLPMIEHVFENVKLDESAQKQARRILAKLQERGYYV
jgi:hypothetical protein